MDSTTFLEAQSVDYQQHLAQLKTLTTAIEHQLSIQAHKSIPKKYLPPHHLCTYDTSLTEDFTSEYKQLFFKHLGKVITKNQIKAELHKAALTNIITQTELYLCKSTEKPEELAALRARFLKENNITDRNPIPELQAKFHSISKDAPKQTKRNRRRKRRNAVPPPQPTKHARHNQSFLCLGPHQTQTPP